MTVIFNFDTTQTQRITEKIKLNILNSVKECVIDAGPKLTNNIKNDKLSGQVLNKRTGNLKRSISNKFVPTSTGYSTIVYTDVKYAAKHEYGFRGTEFVKEHLREVSQAFGKSIQARSVRVRAFTRKVNFPERSFMRSALNDFEPTLFRQLNTYIVRGLGNL